jgi:divalent metal cation (Fe/Co/Zn/Cd) transporter
MVGVIRDDAERAIRAAFPEIETVLVEVDPSQP